MTPQRIQLRRTAGWRLQTASRELNGLPAQSVARPHPWSNPHVIGRDGDRAACLKRYAADLLPYRHGDRLEQYLLAEANVTAAQTELAGHNLACWCPLTVDCHADLLIRIANDLGPMPARRPNRHPGMIEK